MTQELACLLIGLGMLIVATFARAHYAVHDDTFSACTAAFCTFVGTGFIFIALAGYISSLPSIKEVGR